MTANQDNILQLGKTRFDRDIGRLVDPSGGIVPLSPQAGAVLRVLVDAEQKAVPKETLISVAWGGDDATDEDLVNTIAELRQAIGQDAHGLIQAVPGIGYKLSIGQSTQTAHRVSPLKLLGLAVALLPVVAFIIAALINVLGW